MAQGQQRYLTAMKKYTHLRMLHENFRSRIFPPAFASIAGVLMKPRATHTGQYRSRLNSDVVSLSARGARDSGCISGVKFVSASQISLLWRTPWLYGRAYGSAFENTQREIRGSDQDDDDVDGEEHIEDDDDVEDEQYIEDDDEDEEDDEEDEESHIMQSQGPVKKKIQPKPPKSKAADRESQTLNENITAKIIRLVNDGEGHRIVSRQEALALAKDKNMDLVLVDGRSNPPVCKIFDFHKEEYRQEQVKKERRKQKGAMAKLNEMKELRFNTKTEPKDLKMKVDKAKQFMDRGYRVKFVANLKGSFGDEEKKQEQEKMINAIYSLVEDIAVIEQGPRLETRHAWLVLRHVKFGQNKKKIPKDKLKIGATEHVDNMKDEVKLHGEPDHSEGHEEKNSEPVQSSFSAIPELNTTSIRGTSPVGRSQGYQSGRGYPSKVAGSSMKPSTLWNEVGRSPVQPPSPPDPDGLRTRIQPPPHAFPQHTPSLQGLGGLRGLETPVAPPHGSPPGARPMPRGAGVQVGRLQVSPASGSPLHEVGQSHLQTPQDSDGLKSQMKPVPPRAFPQHTPSLPGFGGLRGFETPASAPRDPSLSTPILQDAGVQGPRRQVSAPGGAPLFNVHDADHSYLQPPPSQDPYEGLLSGIQPAAARGFSQLKGFGGLRHSGMPVSPPCGPALSTPTLQDFGAQSSRTFSPPQHAHETGHSCVQPTPPQVSDEGLMYSSPPRGFPQHAPSLRGFGSLQGSETLVPPPRGPPPSTPMLQGPGIQDSRMLFPPPGRSPVRQAPEVGHSYLQPPPPPDPDEGLRSGMQPPPARGHTSFLQGFGGSRGPETPLPSPRGFPQHTPFLQGFGGQRGSETHLSPPPGPQSFTPMPQSAGVQGPRMQVAPPEGFPPQAHKADHPHVQPPPLLDLDGFRSPGMQRPPSDAYPQQTTSPQEFGGLRGSETLVSPPRAPPMFTPMLQGVGGQGPRMQGSPPGGFPQRAHEPSHSHGLPPRPQDSDGLISGMQLPRRGFPGFAGVRASEACGFQRDGQCYQQNQASQGYPPQRGFPQTRPAQEAHSPGGDGQIRPQSQASQGYPLQSGFLQTRPAQEAYSPRGDGQILPQSQASQGYALQRGFLQTPPVAPPASPPPGYRSWSKPPPQSQEYAPLFEPPSEKT